MSEAKHIPAIAGVDITPTWDYALMTDGKKLILALLFMGNSRAGSFLSPRIADFPLVEIGPEAERHPLFPQRTDSGIAGVLSRRKIEARAWEWDGGGCAVASTDQLLSYIKREVDIIVKAGFWLYPEMRWGGVACCPGGGSFTLPMA